MFDSKGTVVASSPNASSPTQAQAVPTESELFLRLASWHSGYSPASFACFLQLRPHGVLSNKAFSSSFISGSMLAKSGVVM